MLLRPGRRLGARDIGLLAAMNRPWLFVHRRPRIGILSTGDEIVMPGDPIGPHQIVSSNSLALAAIVAASGGAAVSLGNAPDDRQALRRIVAAATGVDLLVTTGGVSVGEHDLVREALAADGFESRFLADRDAAWKAADGRALPRHADARAARQSGFDLCLRPVVPQAGDRALGRSGARRRSPWRPRGSAAALAANDRRQDYLRARLGRAADGVEEVTAFEIQDSSMMRLLSAADCLIVRPPHAPAAAAGSAVPIIRFPTGASPI